jgi:C4-dicarboxylate-binding protein DctP
VTETRNAAIAEVDAENRQAVLDAGGEIRELTPEQREAWVNAMKPVWEQFTDDVGQENIDAAQAFNSEVQG